MSNNEGLQFFKIPCTSLGYVSFDHTWTSSWLSFRHVLAHVRAPSKIDTHSTSRSQIEIELLSCLVDTPPLCDKPSYPHTSQNTPQPHGTHWVCHMPCAHTGTVATLGQHDLANITGATPYWHCGKDSITAAEVCQDPGTWWASYSVSIWALVCTSPCCSWA